MTRMLSVRRVIRLDGNGSIKAFCDLAVGELLLIRSFRIIEGKKGLFVAMPRELGKNGQWYDSIVPMTKEAREAIQRVILDAYEQPEGDECPA